MFFVRICKNRYTFCFRWKPKINTLSVSGESHTVVPNPYSSVNNVFWWNSSAIQSNNNTLCLAFL